jgi:DNA-binding CsgD family transcriptional regulator
MARCREQGTAWPVLGMVVACLFGVVVGGTAMPGALLPIVLAAFAQLGATACGLLAPRRPVLWAVAVAVASLGSTLPDPRLAELVHSGAVPWVPLGAAMAAENLFRHARDRLAVAGGIAALALGSVGVVVVGVRAGVPVATAVLAASVPYLVGALMALMLHLSAAREDRVRGPARTAVPGDVAAPGGHTGTGSPEAARRALAVVALRCDELAASSGEESVRRAAADLRDVAGRGLDGTATGDGGLARIELHVVPARPERADVARKESPPADLPDREREILRLVATGASNAAIGRSLYLSEATVKQYVSRLMRRFERGNRTQLALMAARWFDED